MDSCPQFDTYAVFHSPLGWIALLGRGSVLKKLTFGHSTAEQAVFALNLAGLRDTRRDVWNERLVDRLQAYASGREEDFRDVEVDLGLSSEFRRKVMACCRQIGWGQTTTYGQLAAAAGYPGAARAVGRSMAVNPVPLVIPCHRVVGGNGTLRGYSGAGGPATKRRLLEMESALVSRGRRRML
jgi:methylated-DNA-[protein]-cysteine S-methyltransferase